MPFMSSLLIGISFFLILPFISSEKYSVSTYPNPQSPNVWHCGIEKPGRICDPDRPPMLTKEERNGLMDLVEEFTESTKMSGSIGIENCARKGIKLGIALAHFAIKGPNHDYSLGIKHDDLDSDAKQYARTKDPASDAVFRSTWRRLNRLDQKGLNDSVAVLLAEKWHLMEGEGTKPNGCNRTMFILTTADPPDVHIWSHPSVPISMSEKEAIIANNANLIATGEYADALKAIIANLRWLILHRQAELFGQNGGDPSQNMPFLFWFVFSMFGLFSVSALLLSIYQLRNNWQLQQIQQNQVNSGNEQIFRMKDLVRKEEKQMNSLI